MQKSTAEILKEASHKTDGHEFHTSIPHGYKKGKTKYIVVTGSVMSGVGKGTFTSCLGNLLKLQHGFDVVPLKFECYLNYDSGTLNPYRHGEVFVLDDGTECDLDLGTYERMLNQNVTKNSFVTVGKVFKSIIDKERAGKYLGRDVEFIPHVTGEIKEFLRELAVKSKADIITIEIGGTVGEIQNSFYLEAMREFAYEEGRENVCFINVTYILQPNSLGEQKSKAAQLGIRALMSVGIQPDIIVCRAESPVTEKIKEKVSISSNVPVSRIIGIYDTKNIYKVPLYLKEIGVDKAIFEILNIKGKTKSISDFEKWKQLENRFESAKKEVTIGIAGKYTNVWDSYLSILKALEHTGPYLGTSVKTKWIETTNINSKNVKQALKDIDGLIIPGGFGKRGTEGKIECIKYARENNVPFLGLCLGFQLAVIEFARNICNLKNASSTEIDPHTKCPVIDILPEQKKIEGLGGTMRLGGRDVEIKPNTFAHKIYGKTSVRERFRHRFECNPEYIETLEKHGLVFSGKAPKQPIMQILELTKNDFFVGVQFHPEFTSKPLKPNPLYMEFIKAALKKK